MCESPAPQEWKGRGNGLRISDVKRNILWEEEGTRNATGTGNSGEGGGNSS